MQRWNRQGNQQHHMGYLPFQLVRIQILPRNFPSCSWWSSGYQIRSQRRIQRGSSCGRICSSRYRWSRTGMVWHQQLQQLDDHSTSFQAQLHLRLIHGLGSKSWVLHGIRQHWKQSHCFQPCMYRLYQCMDNRPGSRCHLLHWRISKQYHTIHRYIRCCECHNRRPVVRSFGLWYRISQNGQLPLKQQLRKPSKIHIVFDLWRR